MNLGEIVKLYSKESKFRRESWPIRQYIQVVNGVIKKSHPVVDYDLYAICAQESLKDDWEIYIHDIVLMKEIEDQISDLDNNIEKCSLERIKLYNKLSNIRSALFK